MRTGIMIWELRHLLDHCDDTFARINDKWVPARPYGWDGIKQKLKAIKLILTEKADVVIWPEGQ